MLECSEEVSINYLCKEHAELWALKRECQCIERALAIIFGDSGWC